MALSDELRDEVAAVFRARWTTRDGLVVPESDDVRLGNDAVKLDATVLYADLAESTALVDRKKDTFAAEVYKTYLLCAARVIRGEGGEITAYDGDRVMAVFVGDTKNTSAVRCALKINYAVQMIINPTLRECYPASSYVVRQAVGVDTSPLFVARTGIRGSNDLVWVGRAANYAAKLCGLRADGYATWITGTVYDRMLDTAKYSSDGRNMWEERRWTARDGLRVYRSSWRWKV